ncbi:MAG: hypothetical protein VB144_11670 [Clostridia bacterium]|nr:hypothetical protein [Clostridia bacterium]
MKVWKVELFPGASTLCTENLAFLMQLLEADLEDSEVGDEITIKVREMTQEKYDNLPEWDGP